jgi:predicted amidohydrolase YtcJ
MINTIIAENLYDRAFVEKWCTGFDALTDMVRPFTPEKTAEITWIPAEQIVAAARMFATSKPAHIPFGLGTDATIVSHYSPFVTLGWVVSGVDVGGNRVLDETLTREEALIAHTRSNAYLFFQENALGSLEVGKQADLVVLDRDYMTVPAADIKHLKPTLTMVGGRVVFSAPK